MDTPARFEQLEIRRELGRGAMGVVYEAFDRATGRPVALKVLAAHGDAAATVAGEHAARFRREAEVAGTLVHPNIVAVYAFAERARLADGRELGPFILMEYVAGGDLKSRLAGGARLPLREVAALMGQLLAGLRHAHARGVVHRDVKPANLLLRPGGRAQLADFGIARVADSDLTKTGEVMGTVTYMSPEQLTGAPVDARADLYACGAILYELLVGEPPFTGSTMTIMQKILNQDPLPPTTLNPALPRALDAVVRTALAKRPADRYADADAFERALARALAEVDDDATRVAPGPLLQPAATLPATRPVRPWRGGPFAIALACVLTLAAVAWFLQRPAAGVHGAGEIERMAWERALATDRSAAYEAYLKVYPDGTYAKLAHVHLASLHAPEKPPSR